MTNSRRWIDIYTGILPTHSVPAKSSILISNASWTMAQPRGANVLAASEEDVRNLTFPPRLHAQIPGKRFQLHLHRAPAKLAIYQSSKPRSAINHQQPGHMHTMSGLSGRRLQHRIWSTKKAARMCFDYW